MNAILMVTKHINRYSTALHTHQNYKLIYCTSGSGRIQFETNAYPYQAGDLIIIAPNVLHINVTAPGFSATYLTVDQLPLKIDRALILHDTETAALEQCLQQIDYFYQQELFNKESVLHSYGDLLTNLISALSAMKKISPVIERLRAHIFEDFSNASLSINELFEQETKYNPNYLKKLFKREVGASPQQYLIQLRLTHATKLLADSAPEIPLSVSKIAYACGYDDPLYFSRSFKTRYGISPKAFYNDSQC